MALTHDQVKLTAEKLWRKEELQEVEHAGPKLKYWQPGSKPCPNRDQNRAPQCPRLWGLDLAASKSPLSLVEPHKVDSYRLDSGRDSGL
ncbi:MAG: hypothetical protein LZF60_380023 [Nitrospira sp.]|nr:MAG: hypothetical protein LZF60_380023 [Nitrospira sp.]